MQHRSFMAEKNNAINGIYIPSLRDKAYHEAGHVVTGYLFYSVEGVNIVPGRLMGMATHGEAKIITPSTMYLGGAENEVNFIDYLKIIICLRAGRYFQHKVSGVDDVGGAKQDEDFLSLYLYSEDDKFYFPLPNMSAWITKDFCSDKRIVDMVTTIAEALIKKPELNKAEIDALLKDKSFDFTELIETVRKKFYRPFMIAWEQPLTLKDDKTKGDVHNGSRACSDQ